MSNAIFINPDELILKYRKRYRILLFVVPIAFLLGFFIAHKANEVRIKKMAYMIESLKMDLVLSSKR